MSEVAKYDEKMAIRTPDSNGMIWFRPDESPFELAGFAWYEKEKIFRRFPEFPPEKISDAVNYLSWCTAGGKVRFRSDSSRIQLRVTLRSADGMDHMPRTGSNGFDLYTGDPGKERFHFVTRVGGQSAEFTTELYQKPADERNVRSFTINFPLYQGVNSVEIGLSADAQVLPPLPLDSKKITVVYGSSIAQGGCASRPGMVYSNILSRRLKRDFYNFGFSGSACGEPEIARLLATLDPELYILDYEPNCISLEKYTETLPAFIEILRASHPETPIIVQSKYRYTEYYRTKEAHESNRVKSRNMQKKLVERLRMSGDKNIYFIDGSDMLGSDYEECTVDGAHATDLGFYRMAEVMEPVIRRILKIKG